MNKNFIYGFIIFILLGYIVNCFLKYKDAEFFTSLSDEMKMTFVDYNKIKANNIVASNIINKNLVPDNLLDEIVLYKDIASYINKFVSDDSIWNDNTKLKTYKDNFNTLKSYFDTCNGNKYGLCYSKNANTYLIDENDFNKIEFLSNDVINMYSQLQNHLNVNVKPESNTLIGPKTPPSIINKIKDQIIGGPGGTYKPPAKTIPSIIGGTYQPSAKTIPSIIGGPGGTYQPSTKTIPSIIGGPGGTYKPSTKTIPSIIGGTYQPKPEIGPRVVQQPTKIAPHVSGQVTDLCRGCYNTKSDFVNQNLYRRCNLNNCY
jgi:hypothetical protein